MKVKFGANFRSINKALANTIPIEAIVAPIVEQNTASKINGMRIVELLAPTNRMIAVSRLRAKAATRMVFITSKIVTNSMAKAIASANV